MNCKKVTDYLHSSKKGFIIARDLTAWGPRLLFYFTRNTAEFYPTLNGFKQPFVVDIDIDVLFQEMAKTLDTYLTPTHPPTLNKISNFALYYLLII